MGVPAFFRWLSVRYPKIVLNALTEDELEFLYDEFNGNQDDPNEINLMDGDLDGVMQQKIKDNNPQLDNLYLDMNGIIHPCAHPQDKPQPKNEIEMFNNIFEYTDKVMKIVKPQRLVYLAIDGVAPRAKQNQQRSRRFRSALDAEDRETREHDIRNKWQKEGVKFTDKQGGNDGEKFDQNVITPGTEFMWRLSKALQYYIMERLQNSPDWKGIKVIFSDASIPGEGEHKILDFIRSQRCQPGYDPNTRHCIYGADADLIMLGLSTHEPHFCILREAFVSSYDKKCTHCGQNGHLKEECPQSLDKNDKQKVRLSKSVQFQFIKLNVVREYLYLEFKDVPVPFQFDFERIIDDFVFLCFFVGNDFLPHLPSLHIREGALDALMVIYKNLLPSLGDYLTKNGEIDFAKVDLIFNDISKIEEEFFKMQRQNEERQARFAAQRNQGSNQQLNRNNSNSNYQNNRQNNYQQQQQQQQPKPQHIKFDEAQKQDQKSPVPDTQGENKSQEALPKEIGAGSTIEEIEEFELKNIQKKQEEWTEEELNKVAAEKMKELVKKMISEKEKKIAESYVDRVKFGSEGWKLRYYSQKFHVHQDDLEEFVTNIKQAYIEGLQWVYSYYYKGCVSWYWFYPFHYAPFASDLLHSDRVQIKFDLGEPALPFEQLMGVFPKQSAHAIPICYRSLLSDPESEIIDFYPISLRLDINGARFAWMGVNLLPFIDRQRLVKAMKRVEKGLTDHEKERNKMGSIFVFFAKQEKSSSAIMQALNQAGQGFEQLFASFKRSDEIGGTVKIHKNSFKIGEKVQKPHSKFELEDIGSNQVYQVIYEHPKYEKHITKLLDELNIPKREVDDYEIYHVNRKFFNGENAVRMLERTLGIDSSVSAIYKPQGYTNSHSTYQGVRVPRAGESVEEYQQNLGKRKFRDDTIQDQPYHRQRRDQGQDYQQQQYPNQYGYQQQQQQNYYQKQQNYQSNNQHHYQQQQQNPINYNLNQYSSQTDQQYYNQNQQQYPPQQQQYQNYNRHQQQGYPQQQQQQQHNPNSVLAQPSSNPQLMNLLQQLGQIQNAPNNQNQQQQNNRGGNNNNNRFQGFMDQDNKKQ